MTKGQWQRIAEDRVRDAEILLKGKRWSAAYYLAGYAVECGLKACIIVFVKRNADVVFREKRYSEKCWTHNLEELVDLAGLKAQRDAEAAANRAFWDNWQIVKDWSETSRYQRKTRLEAEELFQAVKDTTSGVLPWFKDHW